MVEAIMMIRLNKGLIVRDTREVKSMPKSWKASIPTRPDYPSDYFDESEEEEETPEGLQGDNDSSSDSSSATLN
jgi:hypothetical protein